MAGKLGNLFSQAIGWTITTTAGQVYTHGLGFTPTIILLTQNGTTFGTIGYTAANSQSLAIIAAAQTAAGITVDILCGSLHSIAQ